MIHSPGSGPRAGDSPMIRLALSLTLLLLVIATPCNAQTGGIYVSRGITTISGVRCGFSCSDPTNTYPFPANVLDIIDVRVIGDLNMPGWGLLSIGPALTTCPGIQIQGFLNSLMTLPPYVVIVNGNPSLGPYRAGSPCGTGFGLVFSQLQIPLSASGLTITFQGLVYTNGVLTFTRALEMQIP